MNPSTEGPLADQVRWNEAGLAPAIIQNASTGRVLMLGWMNREALEQTMEAGRVHFFSRSRNRLWLKGETSGNHLHLVSLDLDCDADALLVRARPAGPTCHTGEISCFDREGGGDSAPGLDGVLDALAEIVARRADAPPDSSYTARLLSAGASRIAQKVGEEGVEVALAGVAGDEGELVAEAADLLYHLLVLFQSRGVPPTRVAAELRRRFPPDTGAASQPSAANASPSLSRPS